jgi:hypothetical protein
VVLGQETVTLSLQLWPNYWTVSDSRGHFVNSYPKGNLNQALEQASNKWAHGVLRPESIGIRCTKPPLKPKEMKDLAIRAWCELFGVAVPSEEELKEAAGKKKEESRGRYDEWAARLRKGEIDGWNALPHQERYALRKWPSLDLSKADVAGLQFYGITAAKASFAGAHLTTSMFSHSKFADSDFSKAKISDCKFHNANLTGSRFVGASLSKADFWNAQLKNVSFQNAKLGQTNLKGADLCGADFTGATWKDVSVEGAKYDQDTKFPQGFLPPMEMTWVGLGPSPSAAAVMEEIKSKEPLNLESFMQRLEQYADPAKLAKALAMLKAESFKLYAQVADDHLVGVVKSQSDPDLVYSCRLAGDGTYGCCTQNLNICGGLRGSLCKHLLVLIVGMTKNGDLDPTQLYGWMLTSHGKKPVLDKDAMSATFLRYKGAEAGEIDWRPTETLPEDYYAL